VSGEVTDANEQRQQVSPRRQKNEFGTAEDQDTDGNRNPGLKTIRPLKTTLTINPAKASTPIATLRNI